MANEITIYKALATMGQVLTSMMESVKMSKSVKKMDAIVFQEQMHYIKSSCRIKGYGQLARLAIDEMEKTLQNIKQKNYFGDTLEMAMDILALQYQECREIILNYKNG